MLFINNIISYTAAAAVLAWALCSIVKYFTGTGRCGGGCGGCSCRACMKEKEGYATGAENENIQRKL